MFDFMFDFIFDFSDFLLFFIKLIYLFYNISFTNLLTSLFSPIKMHSTFTVQGKEDLVIAFVILKGDKAPHPLTDGIIESITFTGLVSSNGKIDVFAWSKFSTQLQERFVRLSKQKKAIFACLGIDGTRIGIINEEEGRVHFLD